MPTLGIGFIVHNQTTGSRVASYLCGIGHGNFKVACGVATCGVVRRLCPTPTHRQAWCILKQHSGCDRQVKWLQRMQHLDLRAYTVHKSDMERLVVQCTGLQSFKCNVDNTPRLSDHMQKRHLMFGRCTLIPEDSVMPLIMSNNRQLSHFEIRGGGLLTDNFVTAGMATCKLLHTLVLRQCAQFTAASVHSLAAHCPLLEALDLCAATGLQDVRCWPPSARSVNLTRCGRLCDKSTRSLVHCCPSLECLNLAFCGSITDMTLFSLCHSTQLRQLNLFCCARVTRTSVRCLLNRMPRVEYLNVSMCPSVPESYNRRILGACAEYLDVSMCPPVRKAKTANEKKKMSD